MSSLNAWVIQETLKKQRQITLPWVQYTFQVPYSTSVWMMEQMELRGWVEPAGDGLNWRVNRKALCLRRLKKAECGALLEKLTLDCVSALECLQEAQGKPVTAKMVEAAVRGYNDTAKAIRVLTELKLMYFHNEYGFSTISTAENRALAFTVRTCIRRRFSERYTAEEATERFCQILWDNIAKGLTAADYDADDDDDMDDDDDD